MIDIIAQGTIGGHHCFPQDPNPDYIANINLDIRNEINPGSQGGYYIQAVPNGVWVSIARGMDDGERKGGGAGYMAFSIYIPSNVALGGKSIKQKLDSLMSYYINSYAQDGIYTRSKGVDWGFVKQAANELEALSSFLTKPKKIDCAPSTIEKHFAYVNISNDEELEKYLDKPFQPEYGMYNAVFLGNSLRNLQSLSTYDLLSIDLENEVYDIIWLGDTHDYPLLPKTIRKNQINTFSYRFPQKHYESKDVLLSEGSVDDVNSTITIHVPHLNPISYSLKFIINHPEAVKAITATSKTAKTSLVSTDNATLKFIGEQVEMQWHIIIQTNDNFLSKEFDIIPYDNIENGYGISLVEVQIIKVQILYEGKIDTGNQRQKIKFYNKQTYTSERGDYRGDSNSIEFRIPATDDFESIYSITLQEDYKNLYDLHLESINTPGFIVVTVRKKNISQVQKQEPQKHQEKQFRIYVPKKLADSSILYSYQRKSFKLINGSKSGDSMVYTINVPDIHRNEVAFSIDGKVLKVNYASENHTTITIQGFDSIWDAMAYRIGKHKQFIVVSSIAVLVIVLLVCATLFTLDSLGYIEVEEWLGKNDTTSISEKDPDVAGTDYGITSYTTQSDTFTELNQVLEDQKDAWNLDTIKSVVEKVAGADGENTTELKNNDSLAYDCLKRLSWLYKTRDCIDKHNWDVLPALVKADNSNFKTRWAMYIDEDKIGFLRELIVQSNANARKKFEKEIKSNKDFNKKTYAEIVTLWESCKTSVQNNQNQNRNNQQNKTNNVNNNQTSSEHILISEEDI